jgi:hypothetical protein
MFCQMPFRNTCASKDLESNQENAYVNLRKGFSRNGIQYWTRGKILLNGAAFGVT